MFRRKRLGQMCYNYTLGFRWPETISFSTHLHDYHRNPFQPHLYPPQRHRGGTSWHIQQQPYHRCIFSAICERRKGSPKTSCRPKNLYSAKQMDGASILHSRLYRCARRAGRRLNASRSQMPIRLSAVSERHYRERSKLHPVSRATLGKDKRIIRFNFVEPKFSGSLKLILITAKQP